MLGLMLLVALGSILWGGLWGYSTLLVFDVYLELTGSDYHYPMQLALDRLVELVGLGWLKPLHRLELQQRRWFCLALFGLITLGVGVLLWP